MRSRGLSLYLYLSWTKIILKFYESVVRSIGGEELWSINWKPPKHFQLSRKPFKRSKCTDIMEYIRCEGGYELQPFLDIFPISNRNHWFLLKLNISNVLPRRLCVSPERLSKIINISPPRTVREHPLPLSLFLFERVSNAFRYTNYRLVITKCQ